MTFTEFVKAALELGVLPAIALFLIFGLFLQNRRLLEDQRQLLRKFTEVVLRAQVLQGKDTSQVEVSEVELEALPAPPSSVESSTSHPPRQLPAQETRSRGQSPPPTPKRSRLQKARSHYHRLVHTSDDSTEEVLVLQPRGKISIGVGDIALRDAVRGALDDGWKKIALDLHHVTTADSSGVGEIVSAFTTVSNRGGYLVLVRPPEKIANILQITQLITVFEVYDHVEEAIEALRTK